MTGFTPLLRLAWRDLTRNKGRSVVVFLMILLPVLGVAAASTVIATAEVSGTEQVGREMGTADVIIQRNGWGTDQADAAAALDTLPTEVAQALGAGTATAVRLHGSVRVTTDKGAARVDVTEADLRSPLLAGTFRLVAGHLPRSAAEVVVNRALADVGPGMGEKLEVRDGPSPRVVGIVEDASRKDSPMAWGSRGSLVADPTRPGALQDVTVLASASHAVSWDDLAPFQKDGYTASTRVDEAQMYDGGYVSGADVAVFVLVVVMALTEVVLLAGPAFAVSARRRQRELALVAANGGTPRQVRAAVLASAVVVGGVAAVVGAVGGVMAGWLASPIAQHFSGTWFGPRDWSPLQVGGVAVFGLVSAVLAALVPSWIASRQDVVRILAGRRGDPAPARFSPLLGIVLMVVGAGLTFIGVAGTGYGETWIGFGAVATVLGAVALMPLILRIVARLTGRAPLVVRYAVRDGLRHRTRTVPAIGAVMATVAGVVALGIANSSDAAAGEKTYQPQLPMGYAQVHVWSDFDGPDGTAKEWAAVEPVVMRLQPNAVVARGFLDGPDAFNVSIRDGKHELYGDFSGPYNNGIAVASTVPDLDFGISAAQRVAANKVLARGGVVVLGPDVPTMTRASLVRSDADPDDPEGDMKETHQLTIPATSFVVKGRPLATAILADEAATRIGAHVGTVAMLVNHHVSTADEKSLRAAVTDIADQADVYVERGWHPDPEYAIVMLVLTVVGALLMIGGTLTATVLALADAGPDLATLSAVGAAPRTSRAVAMGIAFVIGGVGALLGVLVGAVPGIAVTWPLTSHEYYPYGSGGPHTIDIPWLLLAEIAVGVPVLLALVVGLFARSRLPLVARID